MAPDRVHLVDVGAGFQETARQGGLGGKIEACHRRGPQGRCAARQQHHDESRSLAAPTVLSARSAAATLL